MKFPTAIGAIVGGACKRVLWLMDQRNSGLSRDFVDPGLRSRIFALDGSPAFLGLPAGQSARDLGAGSGLLWPQRRRRHRHRRGMGRRDRWDCRCRHCPEDLQPARLDTDACAVPDAEVEIDRRTGKVWARKFTVAHDCGLIINPDGLRRSGVRLRGASMTPQRPEPALASARRRGMGLGEARPYP